MTIIDSVSTLQEQLLSNHGEFIPITQGTAENAELIVVLKQYRFYKQLCIELDEASITKEGKIKNPLTLINPLDFVWKTDEPAHLKFFSAISRFQNNPTTNRAGSDIEALKPIFKNPPGLRFFYHNTEFSENIVAGSIQQVTVGTVV